MTLEESQVSSIANLEKALPVELDFYHLGKIQILTDPTPSTDNSLDLSQAIAFRFLGDFQALIIFLFSGELDSSMSCEMGNVLASQIANQISTKDQIDLLISPPEILSHTKLAKILKNSSAQIRRTYRFSNQNELTSFEAIILSGTEKESGYA